MWSGQSTTALLALLACTPIVMSLMFALRPVQGAAIAIVGSILLLPEQAHFNIGPIPNLDKYSLPYVAVFIACCIRCPGRVLRVPRERWILLILLSIYVGSIATAVTNPEALVYPKGQVLPGLTAREGVAQALRVTLDTFLPFLLGAALFVTARDGEQLLEVIVSAALLYSLLLLFEARMSPQLHNWIYGFSPIVSWDQTYRWGGHRPNVFLAHGLALAIFVFVAFGAAVILARRNRRVLGLSPSFASFYLAAMLGMCRCTGAIIYGVVCLPLWTRAKAATLMRIAKVLAVVVLIYPILRVDTLPPDGLMEWLETTAPDRHESLAFRFDAEDLVLDHVADKPAFGWGSFGRNYSPKAEHGILDGYWIIMLGIGGWVGFFNAFLPLIVPVFLASRRLRRFKRPADRKLISILTLILIVTTVELLPNGLFTNLSYFLAGALAGITGGHRASNQEAGAGATAGPSPLALLALLPEFTDPQATVQQQSQTSRPRPTRGRTLLMRRRTEVGTTATEVPENPVFDQPSRPASPASDPPPHRPQADDKPPSE